MPDARWRRHCTNISKNNGFPHFSRKSETQTSPLIPEIQENIDWNGGSAVFGWEWLISGEDGELVWRWDCNLAVFKKDVCGGMVGLWRWCDVAGNEELYYSYDGNNLWEKGASQCVAGWTHSKSPLVRPGIYLPDDSAGLSGALAKVLPAMHPPFMQEEKIPPDFWSHLSHRLSQSPSDRNTHIFFSSRPASSAPLVFIALKGYCSRNCSRSSHVEKADGGRIL